jgi:hypothetical protein
MPVREEITYILVHDRLPNHPKIRGLSDGAFRLLIELWCFCGEHVTDGVVEKDVWRTMRTAKARDELLAKHLVDRRPDGDYEVHDWLDIQRSAAEVEIARAKKSAGGGLGNHRRHHVAKRVTNPDCQYCLRGVA